MLDWLRGRIRQLRVLVRRGTTERELSEEIQNHIRMETEQNLSRGMSPMEAKRAALLAFGGVERYTEAVREARWVRVFEDMATDSRYALRQLRRSPGFAIASILTIAIGIGATTAVASMLGAILLRPLPVHAPDRLYDITETRWGNTTHVLGYPAMPYARFERYGAALAGEFAGLAAHRYDTFSLRTDGGAVAVNGSLTSPNYFDVLGLRPALGRYYTAVEPSVVLSHELWTSQFGGDPGVLGTTIMLDSRPFTIVGVAPAEFMGTSVGIGSQLWAPLSTYWTNLDGSPMNTWVAIFGRLRDGVQPARAAAVLGAAAVNIPPEQEWNTIQSARLDPMTGLPVVGRMPFTAFLGMLFATAALVLLIAAGNVAGMLLARAAVRGREIAVRLAIGVGRRRLIRQMLVESAILFLAGAAGGILLAFWLTRVLASSPPPLPFHSVIDVAPDLRVLAFSLAVAAATGIAFGLAPALHATRTDVMLALREGLGRATTRTRARTVFVGAQCAMSVLLVVTGGLFVRTLRDAASIDPGFDPSAVITASIDLRPHGYSVERGRAFHDRLIRGVLAMPDVDNVALAWKPLLGLDSNGGDVAAAPDGDREPNRTNARTNLVDPAFFETMRIPIIAGRALRESDNASAPPVIVVNQTLADRLWPGQNPIGRILETGMFGGTSHTWEVIGVTPAGRYGSMSDTPVPYAFFPYRQVYASSMIIHVRTRPGAVSIIDRISDVVRDLDPNIAVQNAAPMEKAVQVTLFPQRFAAWLIGGFGIAGLVLALIGVYGVLAFQVAQGTREFGIRSALGARTAQLMRQVVGRGLVVVAAGSVAGLAMAAVCTRFIRSFLFGTSPLDPLTFVAAGTLMLAVAVAAAWFPARRACAISPIEALRAE